MTNLVEARQIAEDAPAHRHRCALVVRTFEDLVAQLESVTGDNTPSSSATSPPGGAVDGVRVALLFTGQGSQYVGMAMGLYAESPAFARHLDRVIAAVDAFLPGPLLPVLRGDPGAGDIGDTEWTQPALFAVEVAVAGLLFELGVRPAAVIGHSIGELAAACIAGVFTLEGAARLVAARGRLMGALPRGGAMVAFRADAAVVAAALADRKGVSLAGINGPQQVVISGDVKAVETVQTELADQGVRGVRLTVSHAFHSLKMDPMLQAFRAEAQAVDRASPRLILVSNLTGSVVAAGDVSESGPTSADYWVRHVRGAVRFSAGIAELDGLNCGLAIEVGPHPVLKGLARQGGLRAPVLAVLRRKREDGLLFAKVLAGAWAAGVSVDWTVLHR